jgi:hypothetical protein
VLDGVHIELRDLEGLRNSCTQGRNLGFDGKTLIHPNQVPYPHAVCCKCYAICYMLYDICYILNPHTPHTHHTHTHRWQSPISPMRPLWVMWRRPGRCPNYIKDVFFLYSLDQIWTFNLVYIYADWSFCSTYNVFSFYGLSYIL